MPNLLAIKRPQSEYEELKQKQRTEKNAKVKQRMIAILARWDGIKTSDICQQQRIHRATLHRWVQRFNKRGIAGLADRSRSGCPRKMDWNQLKQDLEQSPLQFGYPTQGWTYRLVQHHLQTVYQVYYHLGSLSYIFRQFGIRSIVPRPQNVRTDLKKIEVWKKK